MKKLRELLSRNDKTGMLVSFAAVGAVLLLALLLPLAFRSPGDGEAEDGSLRRDRMELFSYYWVNGPENGVTVTYPEKISVETTQRCEAVMERLTALCINDLALDAPAPTGCEYSVIRDESGAELSLCRMWLEARGDWQNWLDVCMDAEDGTVLYMYLSRECLNNGADYVQSEENVSSVAEHFAAENGWTLRWLFPGENGTAAAAFRTLSGTVCYQLECKVFDTLVDVKLCCR